jgi:hypothetical protein
MRENAVTIARPSGTATSLTATAIFVRAAGMADDTAVAWLDATLPSWQREWRRSGRQVINEVRRSGHDHVVDRLVELFGHPAA